MKMVYLLWWSDGGHRWVEGVYADKTLAEADIREFRKQDEADGRTYNYSIQERELRVCTKAKA